MIPRPSVRASRAIQKAVKGCSTPSQPCERRRRSCLLAHRGSNAFGTTTRPSCRAAMTAQWFRTASIVLAALSNIAFIVWFSFYRGSAITPSTSFEHQYSLEAPGTAESSHEPFRALVFGAGFGGTKVRAMFGATCNLRLRSLHYDFSCGYDTNLTRGNHVVRTAPLPGFLAHIRLVRAHIALVGCVKAAQFSNHPCPSVRQTFDIMRRHIDQVISSKDVGAIHETPYPEFADYVINASEKIRGKKPIILLSTRDPGDWAPIRAEGRAEDLFCKLKMTDDNGLNRYIGQNLYWCLQVALQNGLGENPIADVLHLFKESSDSQTLASILGDGMHMYQEKMKDITQYHVNLYERTPWLNSSQLALEIDVTTRVNRAVGAVGGVPPKETKETWFPGFLGKRKGLCMSGLKTAFTSGRRCEKLVIFLNFRGSGGTSIVEKLRLQGLVDNLRTNANLEKFHEIQPGNDIDIPKSSDNLRIHSSVSKSRVSDPHFWVSLYERGLDFVSLEDNFVTPEVSSTLSCAFKITQLCNPWDRFFSTYERERDLKCSSKENTASNKAKKACLASNSLEKWMSNHDGETRERQEGWRGGLYSNYYVRGLNGMADFPRDTLLTRDHLEAAKAVLASFDTVLILEDQARINYLKMRDFFGGFNATTKVNALSFSHKIQGHNHTYKTVFEEENNLDIELYQFARKHFKKNKFQMWEKGNDIVCDIPAPQFSRLPSVNATTRTQPNVRKLLPQYLINIHGWPHSGTGFLRRALHKSLNSLRPGSSSIHDALFHDGRYVPEHEGQYLQSVYPEFDDRRDVYDRGLKSERQWMKYYGKLMYLADTCTINSTLTPAIGDHLFSQWSRFFNTSATYLIQKTPTLDVQFLESVKVVPTLHVILVRHPMAFAYMGPESKVTEWRPFSWLDSFAHVLGALAEGKVEWYAVVTYEALVQYYDQVVEELMEVVKSGMGRISHTGTHTENGTPGYGAKAFASGNKPRHVQSSNAQNHRRLELHQSDSTLSYLIPKKEMIENWRKCLTHPDCQPILDGLASDILPHFGYVSDLDGSNELSVPSGPVTVSENHGRVLFSSEGTALRQAKKGHTADDDALKIGDQPPLDLIRKMNSLLKSKPDLLSHWDPVPPSKPEFLNTQQGAVIKAKSDPALRNGVSRRVPKPLPRRFRKPH